MKITLPTDLTQKCRKNKKSTSNSILPHGRTKGDFQNEKKIFINVLSTMHGTDADAGRQFLANR